jgi:addiction module HigA family antidote
MAKRKHKATHPGEVLQRDYLDALGITPYRLAVETGISPQHVGRILHGQRGIGPDMALRLARFFGTSARLWLDLQMQCDLDATETASGREIQKRVTPYSEDANYRTQTSRRTRP